MKKNEEGGEQPGDAQPPMVAGGVEKARSRRRLLRWALGLVPFVAGGGWAASHWLRPSTRRLEDDSGEPDGPVDGWRAEAGLERGGPPEDASDARTQAEQWTRDAAVQCFARHPQTTGRLHFALRADDSYAPAHLVYACWFIEHDRWDLARENLSHPSQNERRWMGRLLWEVGTRLREQRSRLELERGLLLQMYGSELTGHSPTRMESIDLWVELGRWEQALKRSGFKHWPLASLHEESCEPRARDEHTWLQAFAGKATLP